MIVYLIAGRSSAFFYRFTSELIAECVVPPVASVLMKRTPWVPLIAAIGFMTLGTLLVILIMPETLPVEVPDPDYIASYDPQPGVETSSVDVELPSDGSKSYKKWKNWIYAAKEFFDFVTRDRLVVTLLIAFLVLRAGRQAYHMFLTIRFETIRLEHSSGKLLPVLTITYLNLLPTGRIPSLLTRRRKHCAIYSSPALHCYFYLFQ